MKDIYTKLVLNKTDRNNPLVQQAMDWMLRLRDINHFDPEVLQYPATNLMVAYVKQQRKPVLYVPVQPVYMIDALGINPEASPEEIAGALAQVTKTVHWESHRMGWGEFYFPCSEPTVIQFAERHGYARMQYKNVIVPQAPEGSTAVPNPYPEMADIPFFKMKA